MKHSHIVRVTRLSHPKELEFEFSFSFGCRLGFAESPAKARLMAPYKVPSGTPRT
jgi:hypothetical protein